MADFVQNYWCFAPYLGALLLLAVMSILEGRKSILPTAVQKPADSPLVRQSSDNRGAITILTSAHFRTTGTSTIA